jgi:GAF domain-containing protein
MIAEPSNQAFSILYELTQNMAASLDLEATLTAVLESVEQLLPSELIEITLWDAEAGYLVPYRLVGLPGIDHRLEKSVKPYRMDQGYSGYLATHHEALLITDVSAFHLAQPALDRQRYPFQSYMGVPLLVAGDLIGTLELASLAKAAYTEDDLGVLQLLSGQAGVAINNALLYRSESQRSVAMAGLANLAKSASVVQDPQELFNICSKHLSPVDVEIPGFLITMRTAARRTGAFIGLPSSILEWCQASIPADSPAEAIWNPLKHRCRCPADKRIQSLGLNHLALAAGIHHTVLMPLSAGGHLLGYLQVANKRDGTPFDANNLRFLAIIAGQAAPMIENLTLVQQSRRRALRAETLRRIASLTSSAATLEEILKFSLMDLARLLQVDTAAIFLVDENLGEMRVHRGSLFGIPPEISNRLGRMATTAPFMQTSWQQTVYLHIEPGTGGIEQQIRAAYRRILFPNRGLQIRSVVIVPIVVREQGIGELFAGSFEPNFFNAGDAQTISTASGQFASAIERAALYSQTDSTLRQRVDQLVALTRVSRELNTTIKLEDLLMRVYTEALHATRADCGSIILFDLDADPAGLATEPSAVKNDPAILFHFGDECGERLHPLERKVLLQGQALIIDDFNPPAQILQRENTSTAENSSQGNLAIKAPPAHGGVRSALVVPIAYQGHITNSRTRITR